jgi:6-pyruvoyltetrahydropterin/6-carboxytetrahydropterin synthase
MNRAIAILLLYAGVCTLAARVPSSIAIRNARVVTVSGPVDAATGMVCDLGALDAAVQREVLERFDHEHLNVLPEFAACVPTSENLAALIYNLLRRGFTAAHLEKVKLDETSQNSFEYAGGAELRN